MAKVIQFGEKIDGYDVPVLNEREIRAAAGLLFLMMLISFLFVVLTDDFLQLKYAIIIFVADLLIRVFINPKFSPSMILGRLFVRNQVPEYVGAPQKKFAWIIGVVLSSVFFIHLVVANFVSPITGIICLVCLTFLFFETAFGICLGCKIYPMVFKQKAQHCAGEVCAPESKQAIQKTTLVEISVIFGFILFFVAIVHLFNENFVEKPNIIFGADRAEVTMN